MTSLQQRPFVGTESRLHTLVELSRQMVYGAETDPDARLEELLRDRSTIATSDQGRSFQAFYDFLLSRRRQGELDELLAAGHELDDVTVDARTRRIHHDWLDAAERTQQTVRQLSEQLRRFLDDQVWLENRRVVTLCDVV